VAHLTRALLTRVLIDRALEAVNALGRDGEELVEDPVPLFRIELLREVHRPLHVGEEHGDLLALALQHAARGEDLLSEVFGGVGAWVGRGREVHGLRNPMPARVAELPPLRIRRPALRASERLGKGCGAFAAKFRALAVLAAATGALHSD
jgi:hypothetical protein